MLLLLPLLLRITKRFTIVYVFFFLFLLHYLVSWRTRKSFCLFFLLLPKTGANNTYIISLDTLKNVFSKLFVIRDASGHWNFTCFSVFTTTSLRTRNIEKPVNKIKDERRFKGQKREKIQLISKKVQEKRRKGVQLNKLTIKTIAEEQKIALHSDPFWFGHIIKWIYTIHLFSTNISTDWSYSRRSFTKSI